LDGHGVENVIPSLVDNGVVKSGGPQSVIRVVVGGIEAQGSYGPMPAVGNDMTDQEIADVVNYVRAAWSNATPATTGPGEVGTIREQTQTLLNGRLPGGCPTVAQADMAKIITDPATQKLLQEANAGNLVQTANQLVTKVRAAGPKIDQADIVNSLTIAYCPIAKTKATQNAGQGLVQLNQFAAQLYTQVSQKGKD
jgi:hypothetical protein